MHLHLHLKECLQNYGPVHGFWCYSFERCNGILGQYHTNSQSIEVQLMKKFLRQRDIQGLNPPPQAEGLMDMCDNLNGSLHENSFEITDEILKLQVLANYDTLHSDYSINSQDLIHLVPPIYEGILNTNEMQKLKAIYSYIYPDMCILHFSSFYHMSKKCIMAGELFTHSNFVTAFWPPESHAQPLEHQPQVGSIQKFIKHTIKVTENDQIIKKSHIFCVVEWYVNHPNRNHYGNSAIMCMPITYAASASQFMPIQRIINRCAHGKLNVTITGNSNEQVIMAIPNHLHFSV